MNPARRCIFRPSPLLAALLFCACAASNAGPDASPSPDLPADAAPEVPDALPDTPGPDLPADAAPEVPDVLPDVPDPDLTADAAPEVPDALPDVPGPDLPADAAPEVPDALSDTPGPDLPADAAPEVPDALPDVPGPDLPADTAPEVPDALPDAADAPDVTTPPAPHPLFDFIGGVWLTEYPHPEYASSLIEVRLADKASPRSQELAGAEGACELWVATTPSTHCVPECGYSDYCAPDGSCVSLPTRIGMGTVTIAAKGGPYEFRPDESGWYNGPSSYPSDLFDAMSSVTATATGDPVPPFERTLAGIADLALDLPDNRVTLTDGEDYELRWTPAGDGSTVEVVLQTGWHGRPPDTLLWCSAPDGTGKVVLAKALIDGVGIMDPDRPSLFQHPSFVRRVRRAVVDTDYGPLEVALSSQVAVFLKHLP